MRIHEVNHMSNTHLTVPETVHYCPPCADLFGTIDDGRKRCGCSNSEAVAPYRGDLNYGFEMCRYCQAEVIASGSRWSTFYCEHCRPPVLQINDSLDSRGLVSLPIGRHSLMHGRWRHSRPFTATDIVSAWSTSRLRSGWEAYGGEPDPVPWAAFGQFQRGVREREGGLAIEQVARLVQHTEPDMIVNLLRAANAQLSANRNGNPADPTPRALG
jgi:hypothetical protein